MAGAGFMRTVDMKHFLPLAAEPDDSNEPDDGLYETPNFRPRFRLNIERRNPDDPEIEFKLKVDRALAQGAPAAVCGKPPGQADDPPNPHLHVRRWREPAASRIDRADVGVHQARSLSHADTVRPHTAWGDERKACGCTGALF